MQRNRRLDGAREKKCCCSGEAILEAARMTGGCSKDDMKWVRELVAI